MTERGNPEQRAAASRTLALDTTFRALRAAPVSLESSALVTPVPMPDEKRRTIYTAGNQQLLPGEVVATEDAPPALNADAAVRDAFDGLGATWDFYSDVFDRHSIDDEGKPLDATVHYGTNYNNAFWNGSQMVFGDGDGMLFNRFTASVDVIGHELAHGVTEDEAGLVYMFQPGALNESLSDVFGSMIKQKLLNQTAQQADWLIGAGLFTATVSGEALRSMKAPGTAYDDPTLGKDPQPADMAHFVDTFNDNGGVHINSGIPNRAFYLVASNLGGFAWEKAGRIWYDTLRDSALRPNTGLRRFAKLTATAAERLYGHGSIEQAIVADAWATVGITVSVGAMAMR
ncbi:MAG: M4 family metallopeptidase [Acidobacteriota bacterium]